MHELSAVQQLVVFALPLVFAITVHEVAHGWVARHFGDPTAMMLGRLTLNPLKHIDPVGTLLVPGLLLLMHVPPFGWAKPVPVTWENLRHPKRDMIYVAAAGPLANLLMGVFWALVMKFGLMVGGGSLWMARPLAYMGEAGITINVILMTLNLVPLPPLDGGRVVTGLLPNPWAWKFGRVEPYGFLILVVLLYTGILGRVLTGPIELFQSLLYGLVGA